MNRTIVLSNYWITLQEEYLQLLLVAATDQPAAFKCHRLKTSVSLLKTHISDVLSQTERSQASTCTKKPSTRLMSKRAPVINAA